MHSPLPHSNSCKPHRISEINKLLAIRISDINTKDKGIGNFQPTGNIQEGVLNRDEGVYQKANQGSSAPDSKTLTITMTYFFCPFIFGFDFFRLPPPPLFMCFCLNLMLSVMSLQSKCFSLSCSRSGN